MPEVNFGIGANTSPVDLSTERSRYIDALHVKKWVRKLNANNTQIVQKTKTILKNGKRRILPKGAKVRAFLAPSDLLFFNHGGELNFLNGFFQTQPIKDIVLPGRITKTMNTAFS